MKSLIHFLVNLSLSKNRIEMDELICNNTYCLFHNLNEIIFGKSNDKNNHLIEVTFGPVKTFMKFYQFNQLPYTVPLSLNSIVQF